MHDQEQHYPGRFSLFFEVRDALEGKPRIASFDENMPASYAVLIVLTKSLAKDAWCNFLIDQAYSLKVDGWIKKIKIIMVSGSYSFFCVY